MKIQNVLLLYNATNIINQIPCGLFISFIFKVMILVYTNSKKGGAEKQGKKVVKLKIERGEEAQVFKKKKKDKEAISGSPTTIIHPYQGRRGLSSFLSSLVLTSDICKVFLNN